MFNIQAMRPMSQLLTPALSKSDQARARLLEAAVRIFGEKGVKGATVRDIAKAAGQNVAAIAYYFGSKEKLYQAIIEGIVREIRHTVKDVLEQIERLQREAQPSPIEALGLVRSFLGAVYLRVLSRNEALPIVRLIVREQLGPTPAFEILYQKAFRQLHEALCFLMGVALGNDPRERSNILRTHMLMGQVYFFAMSRETILRRLGWRTLEGKNAELVVEVLYQNIDALLASLAQANTNPQRHSLS
jgi:TetR/AcrR family transcriptional regulator, regulator of cefoperazone and chloramphenicol sensitivity